ncbi:MAG: PAS domain-containing protein, partial [Pseudomonadota bacterium]
MRLGYCNQNYKRIFKKSAHLLTPGRPIEEIVRQIASSDLLPTSVEDNEAWIKERVEIACRKFDEPYFLQLKDGRWIRAINCKTDDGGFLAIRTDITEVKQREAALQAKNEETRNILEAFFENSPVPMLVKDTDSRYRAVNSAFVDVHGIPEKDILNKRMEDALPKTAAALGELADQSILEGDGPVYREHTIYRADGGERNVATTKFPVRDSAGAISAIVAISIDITKSMEMQATLSSKSRLLETTL